MSTRMTMVAKILDGKACAAAVEESLKERISKCQVAGITPHIAVIIVGDDPASHVYVGAKIRACERLGIKSTHIELPESSKETELIEVIEELNNDNSVHGILIQSPLPNHMNEELLTDLIDPLKDVDGFHPVNLGRLVQSRDDCLIPCTPNGVMRLLDWAGIDTKGKRAILLASRGADATVTIAHSRTVDIATQCLDADLIVAAVGRPNLVKKSWIKPGAIVVDVGITRVDDADAERGYILVGDVEKSASQVASWITPVPGGVGPMTVAMLMENTVRSAEFRF